MEKYFFILALFLVAAGCGIQSTTDNNASVNHGQPTNVSSKQEVAKSSIINGTVS
jgi:fucose permease